MPFLASFYKVKVGNVPCTLWSTLKLLLKCKNIHNLFSRQEVVRYFTVSLSMCENKNVFPPLEEPLEVLCQYGSLPPVSLCTWDGVKRLKKKSDPKPSCLILNAATPTRTDASTHGTSRHGTHGTPRTCAAACKQKPRDEEPRLSAAVRQRDDWRRSWRKLLGAAALLCQPTRVKRQRRGTSPSVRRNGKK